MARVTLTIDDAAALKESAAILAAFEDETPDPGEYKLLAVHLETIAHRAELALAMSPANPDRPPKRRRPRPRLLTPTTPRKGPANEQD